MIIVFDLSGVLFNSGLRVAVERISRRLSLEPSKVEDALNGEFAKGYRTGLVTSEQFWSKVKERFNLEEVDTFKDLFFNAYHTQPETVNLINDLKGNNIQVAFLSNSPEDRAKYLNEKYSFISLFDFGLFSFEAKCWKPQKVFYQRFLDKFSLYAKDIIYTDDKLRNLEPAKELGMDTVLFEGAEKLRTELKRRNILDDD